MTTAFVYGLLVVSEVVFGLFFALVITCVLRGVVLVVAPRLTAIRSVARARIAPRAEPAPVPVGAGSRAGDDS